MALFQIVVVMVTATARIHQRIFACVKASAAVAVDFFNLKANLVLKKLTHLALVCF
jgi:hypothetical protein